MDVVVFCFTDKWQDWDVLGASTRSSQITQRLSRHPAVDRLLVVNTPSSMFKRLYDAARGRLTPDAHRVVDRDGLCELRQVGERAFVLDHVRLLPNERQSGICFAINGALFDRSLIGEIRYQTRRLGMRRPVIWLNGPLAVKYVDRLDGALCVYDTVDDWSQHPQYAGIRRTLAHTVDQAFRQADVVFSPHRFLDVERPLLRGKVFRQPNACDGDLFRPGPFRTPPELQDLKRPIIGYAGSIQDRLDVGIVRRLAEAMPEATLIFVGRVSNSEHIKGLASIANVNFLGHRRHEEIPAYLSSFDVAVIPHILDDFTRSMDPVKMYEYLALGKPVVASRNPQIEMYKDIIHLVDDAEMFVGAVRYELTRPRWEAELKSASRIAFARKHTWQQRVDDMVAIVLRYLGEGEETHGPFKNPARSLVT